MLKKIAGYTRRLIGCRDQGPLDPQRTAPRWSDAIAVTATRAAVVFGGEWVVWNCAGFFDVDYMVSAMFLPAAFNATVPMLLGAGWLPWLYFSHCAVALLGIPGWTLADVDHLGALRHITVYGAMGLYLRYTWFRSRRRFSLETATRFISVAFLASLTATALTQFTHTYMSLPPEQSGLRFLALWGGDFSGVMVGVPTILMLRRLLTGLKRRDLAPIEPTVERADLFPILRYGLFACFVACFSAWLPAALGVTQQIPMLMFFPIVLAGLSHGTIVGFVIAGLSCGTYLLVGRYFGIYQGDPIDVQLIFAISAGLALSSGAARDDRLHEWRLANFDLLTGLPNRRLLADRIEQDWRRAQREGQRMAVLYIDLDGFKLVNDTFGHDTGDRLLVAAGGRIKQCLRPYDTVARLGGDEFVAVLSQLEEIAAVDRVAERILGALAQPFDLGDSPPCVTGSIGIAVFPDDGDNPEIFQGRADEALYSAKREGRNRYSRHRPRNGSQEPFQ